MLITRLPNLQFPRQFTGNLEAGEKAMLLSTSKSHGATSFIHGVGTPVIVRSKHYRTSSCSFPLAEIRSPAISVTKRFQRPLRAIANEDVQLGSVTSDQQTATKYGFLIANAKFMLDEEEHFKELMFERQRNYQENDKERDFWLVIEPKFLDKFPDLARRLKRPAVALVSTNNTWITFMKLRLDRVLRGDFEAETLEEALASNPVDLHFNKPDKWTAPYPKYEYGWWEPFLRPKDNPLES